MIPAVRTLLKGSETVSAFKQKMAERKSRYKAAIKTITLLGSSAKNDQLKRKLGLQLMDLEKDIMNFTDNTVKRGKNSLGHRVIVQGVNYYHATPEARGSTPEW